MNALKYKTTIKNGQLVSGLWSRRINQEHCLVYSVSDQEIVIVSCKFHYYIVNVPVVTFLSVKVTTVASRPFDPGYGLAYNNLILPGMSGSAFYCVKAKISALNRENK